MPDTLDLPLAHVYGGGNVVTGSLPRLEPRGRIFYSDGQPWRWKGVSAFALLDRFARGENIDPFLEVFAGFNLLRVFLYVDWVGTGWRAPDNATIHRFLDYCEAHGFYVELVLLTGSNDDAQGIVTRTFAEFERHANLLIELVNEPDIYDKPDTSRLVVPITSIIWTSGDYVKSEKARGRYGVAHTTRDASKWPSAGHELMEYYNGGGPNAPTDPAHRHPWIGDEPIRPDQAGFNVQDFRAYFGVCSILGAGATFHFESGKYGLPPTPAEETCAAAALEGLDKFPADAPLGPYNRIDERGATLRTYQAGIWTVRVRPLDGVVFP